MKTLVTIFALLALSAVAPAFAAENAPLPVPSDLVALSAPACSSAAASGVPNSQENELPSWLTAEKPLIWTGDVESLTWLGTSCAKYCAECGGCCAIGPNWCACC